jgi:hypothetical protein
MNLVFVNFYRVPDEPVLVDSLRHPYPRIVINRWVAHHSALTEEGDGVIFGASKLSQIEQTAGGIKKGKLSEEAVKSIEHVWETVKAEAPVDNYVWSKGSKA